MALPPRPPAPPARVSGDRAAPGGALGFTLFILVNALLLIRPTDLVIPELQDWPLYQIAIVACLVVSYRPVLAQLTIRSLISRPITLCVVGLLLAVVLSHLSHGAAGSARLSGAEFAKHVIYYLLLVGLLNSAGRLRRFLLWLVRFTALLSVLALLQYHGAIDLPALAAYEQRVVDRETGEELRIARLRGPGIFNDPNDLCLILVMAMAVCLYRLGDCRSVSSGSHRAEPLRPAGCALALPNGCLQLAMLGLFGYTLILTHSRGGFIALLVGLLVFFYTRFGRWKATLLAGVVLPVLFALFAGRQTSIDLTDRGDTSQARIQHWSEGLAAFRGAPVFGTGTETYGEVASAAAHNSFIHCYVELGLFGGTLFLGAFYLALRGLHRFGSRQVHIRDAELRRVRPYLMAIVAAYAACMLSLSRAYITPTYMVLGLAEAYLQMATAAVPLSPARFGARHVVRLVLVSLAFVAASYLFVRLFVRWG
jgi:hypothetical protein